MEKTKNVAEEAQTDPSSLDDYIRIAVVGNVDSGKSTLVGVLTKNLLDDGRGSARLRVFNYPHEASNGRTSSIAQEIMGFDAKGQQVFADHFVQSKNKYWAEVVHRAKKVVSLIDLCGHEKYLKTTMLGMVGLVPDYVMIVVGANLGLSKMTKEHLGIALALNIPFFIILTKVDMVSEETAKQTIAQLSKLMNTSVVNKRALLIDYDNPLYGFKRKEVEELKDKVDNVSLTVKETKTAPKAEAEKAERRPSADFVSSKEDEVIKKAVEMIKSERVCPIFPVSSTEGYGVPQLTRFMNLLHSRAKDSKAIGEKDAPIEFDIHERFVVNGVGLVVSGLLKSGTVVAGTNLILGPDKYNNFRQVHVKTIHFNRVPTESAFPGQFCCLALKSAKKKEELDRRDFRKGIVLLDSSLQPSYCVGFEADIAVLHHATTIRLGYECVMHCGVVRQSVRIVHMDRELLRTGDNGALIFRFMFNNEYIKPNTPFLLREGRTKILGVIRKVFKTPAEMEAAASAPKSV